MGRPFCACLRDLGNQLGGNSSSSGEAMFPLEKYTAICDEFLIIQFYVGLDFAECYHGWYNIRSAGGGSLTLREMARGGFCGVSSCRRSPNEAKIRFLCPIRLIFKT